MLRNNNIGTDQFRVKGPGVSLQSQQSCRWPLLRQGSNLTRRSDDTMIHSLRVLTGTKVNAKKSCLPLLEITQEMFVTYLTSNMLSRQWLYYILLKTRKQIKYQKLQKFLYLKIIFVSFQNYLFENIYTFVPFI